MAVSYYCDLKKLPMHIALYIAWQLATIVQKLVKFTFHDKFFYAKTTTCS